MRPGQHRMECPQLQNLSILPSKWGNRHVAPLEHPCLHNLSARLRVTSSLKPLKQATDCRWSEPIAKPQAQHRDRTLCLSVENAQRPQLSELSELMADMPAVAKTKTGSPSHQARWAQLQAQRAVESK